VAAVATQLFYYGVENISQLILQMNALGCSTADHQEIFLKVAFVAKPASPQDPIWRQIVPKNSLAE
jgi:hypothetical protein